MKSARATRALFSFIDSNLSNMKRYSKTLIGCVLALAAVGASAEPLWTHTLTVRSQVVGDHIDSCARESDVTYVEDRVVCSTGLLSAVQKPTRVTVESYLAAKVEKVPGKTPVLVGTYAPDVGRYIRGGKHTVIFYKYE